MPRKLASLLVRHSVGVSALLLLITACRTGNFLQEWDEGHPAAAASTTAPNPPLPHYLERRAPIDPVRQTSGEAVHPEPPMTVPGEPAPRSLPPMEMKDMKGHSHHDM
ncbi:MAG: hypothetical protein AB7N71_11220 [Phycisphaerae bacterium]